MDKSLDQSSSMKPFEDKIRIKEKNKEFDDEFIELARSVYLNNDRRSETKKELNIMFNSEIIEEKSYEKY